MDVRCDRCGTEYEFDDALLSERGTTVQCTECSFRFKVYPVHGAPAPERWIVRSAVGSTSPWEYQYGSLRDLQSAILRGAVGPTDVLSRGLEAPRPLGSIAELEPLFIERGSQLGRTLAGVAPQAGGSVPPPPGSTPPPAPGKASEPLTRGMPVRHRVSTKLGLPGPAQVSPGTLNAPPPLEDEAQKASAAAPEEAPRPKPGLGGTLLGMAAPKLPGAAAPPDLAGMEVVPAGRSTTPHAPRVASELARTQRSLTEEEARAPRPVDVQSLAPRSFKKTLPSFGNEPSPAQVSPPPASPAPASPAPALAPSPALAPTSPVPSPASSAKYEPVPQLQQTLTSGSPAAAPELEAARAREPAPGARTLPSSGSEPLVVPPAAASPPRTRVVSVLSSDGSSADGALGAGSSEARPHESVPTALTPGAATLPSAPAAQFLSASGAAAEEALGSAAEPPPGAVRVSVPVATSGAVPDEILRDDLSGGDASRGVKLREPTRAEPALDEEVEPVRPRRRGVARWVVAFVVLSAGAFLAGTLGKKYWSELRDRALPTSAPPARPPAAPTAPTASDVAPLVAKANELLNTGDLEGAREQLTRADALSRSAGQPHAEVQRLLAEVDVTAADVAWLRLRLLPTSDVARLEEAQRELERRTERARVSARAVSEQQNDRALAAQAALSRVTGDAEKARSFAGALPSGSPESAYALGALELMNPEPRYASVVEHASRAAESGGAAALPRSLLVYGLVRSGDVARAKVELAALSAASEAGARVPLLSELSHFVEQGGTPSPAESAAAPSPAQSAPAPRPVLDFRARLVQASQALGRGELTQAHTLYRSVLEENPANTEALAGLADVARRRGQSAEAARLYEQVLASNPSYLPALVGRADQLWAAGDRAGALKLYRRVIDQAGTSTSYGRHAQARINEAERATPPAPEGRPDSLPSTTPDFE